MPYRVMDATELRLGDHIITNRAGRVQRVDNPTELDQYGGCAIHTAEGAILTNLPCPVKVIN